MPSRVEYAAPIAIAAALAAAMGAAPTSAADESPPRRTEEQLAAELANPLAPITTFVTQYRSEFDNGPDGATNHQLRLQPSFFKPLERGSALLVRSIVPLRKQNWPSGERGLGDVSVLPYYVPDIRSSTFVGYGLALTLPTANETPLGTGNWSATLTSESSYNWNGAAGQRWVVPVAVSASKVVDIGGQFFNLGVAYVHYVEALQFATQSELRLDATYVFK